MTEQGVLCACAAFREALGEHLGEALLKAFLAVHKFEVEWSDDLVKDIKDDEERVVAWATHLYDRY